MQEERRKPQPLPLEQIEQIKEIVRELMKDLPIAQIADMAADRAVDKMTNNAYKIIGKTFVEKALIIIGAAVVFLVSWFNHK